MTSYPKLPKEIEREAEIWKNFITKVHIFCQQKDKTDTEDLEQFLAQTLAEERERMLKEMEKRIPDVKSINSSYFRDVIKILREKVF